MPCCRFQAINGVLIPGGGARLIPTHHFYDVAAQLVHLAKEANDQGTHFPVSRCWAHGVHAKGVCMLG